MEPTSTEPSDQRVPDQRPGRRMQNKVAIITGAARGMGEATARVFVRHGAQVILVDKREELGTSLADELNEATAAGRGTVALFANADVTSEADWQRVVDLTVEQFGAPNVLVNNAGIIRVQPLLETDLETFDKVITTNLTSCFLGMSAVAPLMASSSGGSIINVASPQGFEGRPGFGAYSASKFAIRGLTRTAAIEFGPMNIRVNCVVPGPIRTAMTNRPGWVEADYDTAYAGYPLGRRGEPDEVANVTVFLASDESSYCTGGDYLADGGTLAGKPTS